MGSDRRVVLGLAVGAACVALVAWVVAFTGGAGLSDKTLWDWLELLLVPAALAVGAAWLQHSRREADQRNSLESDRRQMLAIYFDRMEALFLDRDLNSTGLKQPSRWQQGTHNEVVEIARARTLQVLRNMDGRRKGHVIGCALLIWPHLEL